MFKVKICWVCEILAKGFFYSSSEFVPKKGNGCLVTEFAARLLYLRISANTFVFSMVYLYDLVYLSKSIPARL